MSRRPSRLCGYGTRWLRAVSKQEFFFEKKNQKTSIPLRTLPERRAQLVKSFLLLFFKKEELSFLWMVHAPQTFRH
jgi:hypothetical protein